ncbi:hypothetical protein RhiJN_08486 [Ceratobasidium sp. AG-Ba]|nr:hypothetical protein RhiJN_08486 [Ceratobasidium sp. AG-Ba]
MLPTTTTMALRDRYMKMKMATWKARPPLHSVVELSTSKLTAHPARIKYPHLCFFLRSATSAPEKTATVQQAAEASPAQSSTAPSLLSPTASAPVHDAPATFPITPAQSKGQKAAEPQSDSSIPARRRYDRYFLADYAFVSVQKVRSGIFKDLMGFNSIPSVKSFLPILIELKRCFPRKSPISTQEDLETHLHGGIYRAFGDISEKSAAVFCLYPD